MLVAPVFLMLALSVYFGIRRSSLWWSVVPGLCLAILVNIIGGIVDARYGHAIVVKIGESVIQWASLIGILCIVQAVTRAISFTISDRRKNRPAKNSNTTS